MSTDNEVWEWFKGAVFGACVILAFTADTFGVRSMATAVVVAMSALILWGRSE